MPTIITHGLVGLALAGKSRDPSEPRRRRLLAVAAICAMLPDFDYIGFKLGVHYSSFFGHRGFSHSLLFAALLALATTWILHRGWKGSLPTFLLLFAATASHGLLDALTDGGEGVALFSPFSLHRYFLPYRPIMVSPLGIESFFHWRGLLILADEFLLVIVPVSLCLYLPTIWERAKTHRRIALASALLWLSSLLVFGALSPLNNIFMTLNSGERPVVDLFAWQYKDTRVLENIPTTGISDGKLVTGFLEFQRRGLFNRRLEASDSSAHWASGFFPNWYGGIAGRWQNSNVQLLLRTLFGFATPSSPEIRKILQDSAASAGKRDFLFQLSPAEKYDLATGDYNFTATSSVLAQTHNASALPQFWYGICNGMAAASDRLPEPFRTVDVINPNGFHIRFHPNDVKALTGYAYAEISLWGKIGVLCNANGPEANNCRVNPGAFFLATMNRLGLAHEGFIVDGFSGTRKQFYLFDAVRVEVLEAPRHAAALEGWQLPTAVQSLARVRFTMELVSTLLSDKAGGLVDEATAIDGYYQKVGRVVVPRVLEAEIALDQKGDVVGGAWLGEEDVTDILFFPTLSPSLDKSDRLRSNPAFAWKPIQMIYTESIKDTPARAPLDFSK